VIRNQRAVAASNASIDRKLIVTH